MGANAQSNAQNALNAYLGAQTSSAGTASAGGNAGIANQSTYFGQPLKQESKKMDNKELLPDISLARVIKWGIVLLIAMGLGKKVWSMFGDKLTAKLHSALDSPGIV